MKYPSLLLIGLLVLGMFTGCQTGHETTTTTTTEETHTQTPVVSETRTIRSY